MASNKLARRYQSWGRYPDAPPRTAVAPRSRDDLPDLSAFDGTVLPYGYGRSYGDSCKNADGEIIDAHNLRRFMAFDPETGVLRCEAGVSLADILEALVPQGWFLPVSPGTKFVSVGGAIANDIHGKNHHKAGTFGCHVRRFELVRSDGTRLECSPSENAEMFRATIGGLGLTGLITWAEVALKPIAGPFVDVEEIPYNSLDEFFTLCRDSDAGYEYTVAWADSLMRGATVGKGIFMRGNHSLRPSDERQRITPIIGVPFDAPNFAMNNLSIKAFNFAYYNAKRLRGGDGIKTIPYGPYFYPLDAIANWNRVYGTRGLLQYQCTVPFDGYSSPVRDLLEYTGRVGAASFVTVMKAFGTISSPGMMSYPSQGITLNLDFPNKGERTMRIIRDLDRIVMGVGGKLYPAKDATMTPEHFQMCYPQWREFAQYIDPKFSSSFWRRVTAPVASGVAGERLLVG